MRLAFALLLVACADEPDTNGLITCSDAWSGDPRSCEPACVDVPAYTGSMCLASNPEAPGVQAACSQTFEHAGVTGCCRMQQSAGEPNGVYDIRFFICD